MAHHQATKTAYSSHAWLGVVTALLLFIVCFTGSVAVFRSEIHQWEQIGLRQTQSQQPIMPVDTLVELARQRHGKPTNFSFSLPGTPYDNVFVLSYSADGKRHRIAMNAVTGSELSEGGSEIADILSHIHTDLDLPKPYGRYLVGLSGVIMLFMIVTGVIQHRRFFKDAFRFRFGQIRDGKRSVRRRVTVSDLHKILGTWGIVFQAMIAFTGSMLGLIGLVLLVMAFAAYDGDDKAALDGFLGPTPEKTGTIAPMKSIADLIEIAEQQWQGFDVNFMTVTNYGDEAAKVTAFTDSPRHLTGIQNLSLSGVSGDVIFVSDFRNMGVGAAIYGASDTLHYAEFGSTFIKFLYLILGVAMSGMGVSGMMMWLERKRKSEGKYTFFSRLTVGVVAGLVVATAMLFTVAMLFPEHWENKAELQHKTYYYTWLAMIIAAYVTPTVWGYVRLSLGACALLCAAAPLLNAWVTEQGVIASLQKQHYVVAGVDLTLLVVAMACAWGYVWLGKKNLPKPVGG